MDKIERKKVVMAMELLARQINDECVFDLWLDYGVADGDIDYGDLDAGSYVDDYYIEDEHFAELMDTFLVCMKKAAKSGGLFCDFVSSK